MATRVRTNRTEVTEEATNENIKEKTYFWKYVGSGTFTCNGRKIRENEVFEAPKSMIPRGAGDLIIKIEAETLQKIKETSKQKAEVEPIKYPEAQMIRRQGGQYDVIDSKGKTVNERLINKKDAEKLLKIIQENKK